MPQDGCFIDVVSLGFVFQRVTVKLVELRFQVLQDEEILEVAEVKAVFMIESVLDVIVIRHAMICLTACFPG